MSMERLTKRVDGIAVLESWAIDKDPVSIIQRLCNRLAAYEDTGIDPDELRIIGDIKRFKYEIIFGSKADRLKELSDADNAGRLIVLPCKVVCGTTIWWADSSIHADPIKCEVSSFGIYTGSDGGLQLWMNCYVYGPTPMSRSFRMSSIGKTVFLTSEDAEAALAGEGGAK